MGPLLDATVKSLCMHARACGMYVHVVCMYMCIACPESKPPRTPMWQGHNWVIALILAINRWIYSYACVWGGGGVDKDNGKGLSPGAATESVCVWVRHASNPYSWWMLYDEYVYNCKWYYDIKDGLLLGGKTLGLTSAMAKARVLGWPLFVHARMCGLYACVYGLSSVPSSQDPDMPRS